MIYLRNYGVFLENKESSTILYHGSPHKFNQFSLDNFKTSGASYHGYGVYLTDDKESSKYYITDEGYIYTVEITSGLNLINWNDILTQNIINTASEVAIDNGIIDNDLLLEINRGDNIMEDGIVKRYKIFSDNHGIKKLKKYRCFENINAESKYPLDFGDWYYNLSSDVFNSLMDTSNFLIDCGIDGIIYREQGVKSIVYNIFNEKNLKILKIEKHTK